MGQNGFYLAEGKVIARCLEIEFSVIYAMLSSYILGLFTTFLACGSLFVRRGLARDRPLVDLRSFLDCNFLVGSALSFTLGIGLFGSVYPMPMFLVFSREHNAFDIGMIMLVTGVTQLITAPIAVALEKRTDARLLSSLGFGVFTLGIAMSAFQD